MCVCPLYEIRKLKKTQRSDQIKFSNSWTFIRQSNHLAAQRPFYLCSFAWCIMHTRWCQIRLLCGVFFVISSHGVIIANESGRKTKTEVEAFKLQTYLVVRRCCWLYEDAQHVPLRAAVIYAGHYGRAAKTEGRPCRWELREEYSPRQREFLLLPFRIK